jgi:tRNA (uracil-5-)-methyltransferase TRM9
MSYNIDQTIVSIQDDIEQSHVIDVYDQIADHFDKTRHSVWPSVSEFIMNLPKDSIILDAGCGNGKNMFIRDDCTFIGTDLSDGMVRISNNKGLNVIQANILSLPFKDNTFDYCISIAVIHHLSTPERRILAIKELLRVTKGDIMVQVWNNMQNKNIKKFILQNEHNKGDHLVKWTNKSENKEYIRYYHLFDNTELLDLVCDKNVEISGLHTIADNHIIIFKKL